MALNKAKLMERVTPNTAQCPVYRTAKVPHSTTPIATADFIGGTLCRPIRDDMQAQGTTAAVFTILDNGPHYRAKLQKHGWTIPGLLLLNELHIVVP